MVSLIVYLYTTVVSIGVMITTSGTATAGQNYSLECSVTGTTDPATYQWLDSNGTQLTGSSQLEFSPLLTSDAGTYTCRATVGSVVVEGSNTLEVNCKILTLLQDFVVFFFHQSQLLLL